MNEYTVDRRADTSFVVAKYSIESNDVFCFLFPLIKKLYYTVLLAAYGCCAVFGAHPADPCPALLPPRFSRSAASHLSDLTLPHSPLLLPPSTSPHSHTLSLPPHHYLSPSPPDWIGIEGGDHRRRQASSPPNASSSSSSPVLPDRRHARCPLPYSPP